MKDKIKDVSLYIGGFYMIIIIVLMIITYFTMVTKLDYSSNGVHQDKLNEYKKQVATLEKSTCKSYLNSLINKIGNDIDTELNIREYYESLNSDYNLLYYYSKAIDDCNSLTIEKMQEKNMPKMFLSSLVSGEEIIEKYMYQYELRLPDKKNRDISEAYLVPVENSIKVQNELEIIEILLNTIDWNKEV